MEIKRTVDIFVETKRRFVVYQAESAAPPIVCAECGAAMFAAEQLAAILGISRRIVYQTIERGAWHFTETGDGFLFVCPDSLGENLVIQGLCTKSVRQLQDTEPG